MDELDRIKNLSPEEQQQELERLQACEHNCDTCSAECSSKVTKPASLVIPVMGGKGGTGKSVVTVLLAKALVRQGLRVAVLDADIAGGSVPALLGMTEPVLGDAPDLVPIEGPCSFGVVSMALILDKPEEPILWPGHDLARLAVWLLRDTKWPKDLDVLLVDMPSGAGDIPLEYYTTMPLDYSIAVTEPGELSGPMARRAVNLADMLRVPVMGVVHNFAQEDMDYAACCATLPVLAELPYDGALRRCAAAGRLAEYETDAFDYLARAIGELR